MSNANKGYDYKKGQKGKNTVNKGLVTKPTPNQPNTMEVRFA
jgi:hypothetical protein